MDGAGTEPFALRFELDAMLRMGNSLNDVLFSYVWDGVTYTIVSRTLLGALYAGLWPLGLVKVASILDNPFSVALARAEKAGKVLAHALIDGVQGKRPVTLMGYSIGARVIHSCLIELAEQNAFGLVEAAVLMGTPTPSDSKSWRKIRSVVTARVVNVYSTEDYILGFLYRSTKLEFGVAGLQEVKGVFGVENVDMSNTVKGHDRYRYLVGSILTKIGFGDIDFNRVAEQERALEVVERKKEQIQKHVRQHKKDSQQIDPSTSGHTEMVIAQHSSNSLINASAPPTTESLPPVTEIPRVHRPMMIAQQRSGQQPFVQRQKTEPVQSKTSTTVPVAPTRNMDPLSGSVLVESSSQQRTEQQTFPSSAFGHKQIPTNIAPTPAASAQRTNFTRPTWSSSSQYVEPEHQITMQDFDFDASQKFSPPLEDMVKHPKADAPPAAPVTAGPITASPVAANSMIVEAPKSSVVEAGKKEPVVAIAEIPIKDNESEYESDSNSEFGELNVVEPEPLDDNDYGLM